MIKWKKKPVMYFILWKYFFGLMFLSTESYVEDCFVDIIYYLMQLTSNEMNECEENTITNPHYKKVINNFCTIDNKKDLFFFLLTFSLLLNYLLFFKTMTLTSFLISPKCLLYLFDFFFFFLKFSKKNDNYSYVQRGINISSKFWIWIDFYLIFLLHLVFYANIVSILFYQQFSFYFFIIHFISVTSKLKYFFLKIHHDYDNSLSLCQSLNF